MFDPKTGWYSYGSESFQNEGKYRFEATYYIKYNSQKGLYAYRSIIDGINNGNRDCFYYHVYLDLLLNASGALYKRFHIKKDYSSERKKQVENNIKEYEYNYSNYPTLESVNLVRNFLEHLDERGERLINNDLFQGTFNVVFPEMNDKEKQEYRGNLKLKTNLLDLELMTYSIYNDDESIDEEMSIDLEELNEELKRIHITSLTIWECMTQNYH